jgi:hypothetical protein
MPDKFELKYGIQFNKKIALPRIEPKIDKIKESDLEQKISLLDKKCHFYLNVHKGGFIGAEKLAEIKAKIKVAENKPICNLKQLRKISPEKFE